MLNLRPIHRQQHYVVNGKQVCIEYLTIVEHHLGIYTRKVREIFTKPVVNLSRGQVRMFLQTAMNLSL